MSTHVHVGRRIFLSYDNTFLSRKGWEVADWLLGEWRGAGSEVLMDDERADPGRQYPRDAIKRAVNRSDVMVALLGLSPSQPDLRKEEHELAIGSGMPLLILNTDAPRPLPTHLSGRFEGPDPQSLGLDARTGIADFGWAPRRCLHASNGWASRSFGFSTR